MTERQIQIVAEAKKVVTDIFKTKVNPLFVFHNLEHTRQVVAAIEEMEGYYQLDNDDFFVLLISAWFHDAGFSTGHVEEHEKESIKLAADFLYPQHVHPEIILQVSSCIATTHMPQSPRNLVEKILCDADLFHLGENIFHIRSGYLRDELQAYFKIDITEDEWRQQNIAFLQSHKYFTGYCRKKLEPVKQLWIKQLQNKQRTIV